MGKRLKEMKKILVGYEVRGSLGCGGEFSKFEITTDFLDSDNDHIVIIIKIINEDVCEHLFHRDWDGFALSICGKNTAVAIKYDFQRLLKKVLRSNVCDDG